MLSIMSNFQINYNFKLDFQKVDQHTGGKWLIHGTKRRKDDQQQSMETPSKISYRNLNMSRRNQKVTCPIQYAKRSSRGRNIQGGA